MTLPPQIVPSKAQVDAALAAYIEYEKLYPYALRWAHIAATVAAAMNVNPSTHN